MSDFKEDQPGTDWERKTNWDHKYRHQNMCVDVDVWYPIFKELTFKTFFVPLERKEARAIMHYFLYRYPKRKNLFTLEDTKVLEELEKKIDSYFEANEELKNGAMFRLSGRSAKDGEVYDNKVIYKRYQDALNTIKDKLTNDIEKDANIKYTIIPNMYAMKVRNGKEVLSLVLSSERLYHDMKDWLTHGGKEQIILRQWEDRLSYGKEFRVFVKNGEIKSIVQYDQYGKYEDNIKNRELYEKLMHEYFKKNISSLMKIKDYAVDFGILNDKEVILIEFSPLLRCTSSRMCKWDRDYEELINGTGKLIVRTEDYPDIYNFVEEWENIYQKESFDFKSLYLKENYSQMFSRYLGYLNIFNNEKTKNVFVVSVLKKGFFWNKKYILYDDCNNQYLGKGSLKEHIIKIDKNGFGWILESKGKNCYGDVFQVSEDDFTDIQYFYTMGDSKMKQVEVILNENPVLVNAFILNELDKTLINENNKNDEVEEYMLDTQNNLFNSMNHIINQQERYLHMSLEFNIKDSW